MLQNKCAALCAVEHSLFILFHCLGVRVFTLSILYFLGQVSHYKEDSWKSQMPCQKLS